MEKPKKTKAPVKTAKIRELSIKPLQRGFLLNVTENIYLDGEYEQQSGGSYAVENYAKLLEIIKGLEDKPWAKQLVD